MTIKDLKEFIERHELPDDTKIKIAMDYAVRDDPELSVVTGFNNKPIKHELCIMHNKEQ